MKQETKTHPLFHASQAEIAEFMGVDRGTIRNWTKAGMPFKENGPGKSAEYSAPIALHWWASQIQRNHYALPEMSACRRLAVARAFLDRSDNPREQQVNRNEFPECFRRMVDGYFSKTQVDDAVAYAEAAFDMKFCNPD